MSTSSSEPEAFYVTCECGHEQEATRDIEGVLIACDEYLRCNACGKVGQWGLICPWTDQQKGGE